MQPKGTFESNLNYIEENQYTAHAFNAAYLFLNCNKRFISIYFLTMATLKNKDSRLADKKKGVRKFLKIDFLLQFRNKCAVYRLLP